MCKYVCTVVYDFPLCWWTGYDARDSSACDDLPPQVRQATGVTSSGDGAQTEGGGDHKEEEDRGRGAEEQDEGGGGGEWRRGGRRGRGREKGRMGG